MTARAGLGLSLLPLPSRIKPWGAPTFQRTLETSSFHFSHLNGYRIARFTRWLQLGLCWGYGWCLCFRGADLEVLRRAEYQGDRLPRVSTSCKTRLHGRYGGTDVSGHAEGDRSGGYLQLLCPVNPHLCL